MGRINFRYKALLEYLMVFVVIFYGQTVWLRMLPVDNRYEIVILFAVLLVILLIVSEGKLQKRDIALCLEIASILFLYSIIAGYDLNYTLVRLIVPFSMFFLYATILQSQNRLLDIYRKFSNIILVLASISIVCYVFGTVLNILPYTFEKYNWTGLDLTAKAYFHLMYETQTENFFGTPMIRNCGIFCEAPSYAVPLSLALFYEMFIRNEIKICSISILTITIITTYSTKAILVSLTVVLLRLIYFAFSSKKANSFMFFLRMFVLMILVFGVMVGLDILDQKTGSKSYIDRMDNIQASMRAFRENVVFGVGPGNEEAITKYCLVRTRWQGLSMGIPVLIAEGGILLCFFYLLGPILSIGNSSKKGVMICFIITHVLIMFSSNIPYFLSTVFILAAEYSYIKTRNV